MLSVEPSASLFLRIRASGLLHAGDYERFEAEFAEQLEHRAPPIALLLDMRGFRGWTLPGLLRDLKWDVRNRNNFSKIAVIGSSPWHKWITALGALLFRGQLNYFPVKEADSAERWLQGRK